MPNTLITKELARTLAIVFFPAFDWAMSPNHPEREERLLYTQDQFLEEGIFDLPGISYLRPELATAEDIERVHFCMPELNAVCTPSHLASAGGAITAARQVLSRKSERGFALVRPPGHHAMRVVHGNRGFCNVNIEAVMLEHLRKHFGPLRAVVVDTDCHHGDGSQDIYWHDRNTLFISLHQDGHTLYPGTGFTHEMGGPNAFGRTINLPLPPMTGDGGYLKAMTDIVMPLINKFKPDIIINSAGQDNHFSDPITDMNLTAQGYAELTKLLNPQIAVLEGGYSIQSALPYVNLGLALSLAGRDYSKVKEPLPSPAKEDASILDAVEALSDDIFDRLEEPWTPKGGKIIKNNSLGSTFVRDRKIFYDGDGITEQQLETICMCNDCSGALQIETRSDKNPSPVSCILIPLDACPACQEKGLIMQELAKKDKKNIKLIDRATAG